MRNYFQRIDCSPKNEWRAIGVQQSRGWVHYAIHCPEPHIMLLRRTLNYHQQQQDAQGQQNILVKCSGESESLLEMMMALGSNCGGLHTNKSCNALLKELQQQLWTEIGEAEADKDRMLMELEQECLGRKVEEAANAKALLHQSIAAREADIAMLMATLGDVNVSLQTTTQTLAFAWKDSKKLYTYHMFLE